MSRDRILNSIKVNKPDKISLPGNWSNSNNEHRDLSEKFIDLAKSAGSEIIEVDSMEKVKAWISRQKSNGKTIIDLTINSDDISAQILSSRDIGNSDMMLIKGQFGVAENGAIWIEETDMCMRKLPFIAGHLVLILRKENIIADMHQAYDQIDLSNTGFGVFVAGPSKTADIEQSLVIGAHGPIKHTVLLF